jgi:hypothetical protein
MVMIITIIMIIIVITIIIIIIIIVVINIIINFIIITFIICLGARSCSVFPPTLQFVCFSIYRLSFFDSCSSTLVSLFSILGLMTLRNKRAVA